MLDSFERSGVKYRSPALGMSMSEATHKKRGGRERYREKGRKAEERKGFRFAAEHEHEDEHEDEDEHEHEHESKSSIELS